MSMRDIVGAIGAEAATKLVDRVGGQIVYIPMGRRPSKKAEIAAAEGSDKDVARLLGVSVRWVQQVRRGK